MGSRGQSVVEKNRGSLDRHIALLQKFIPSETHS